MFEMWFLKALKRRYAKMSVEKQTKVRELVSQIDETKSETKHKSKKQSKRRIKNMADEKEVKTTVETSKIDDETKNNEVDKEKSTDKVEKSTENVDETKKEVVDTSKDETTNDVEPTAQVQETEPQGNGVDINDLVTKDMLSQALSSMEAKFNAVVKENQDLKDKLTQSQKDTEDLREKYENKDFGNFNKQGVMSKDKSANSSFDEYSKQFM